MTVRPCCHAVRTASGSRSSSLADRASGWVRLEGREWLGFRPTCPDSLPVIGRSTRASSVVYAFGHQHLGWTLGGVTGRLVSELVGREQSELDLTPFAPDRFALW